MSKYDQCHSGKEQQHKESILQSCGWGTAVQRACGFIGMPVSGELSICLSSPVGPSPILTSPTPTPPWNPRPSLKEKWRIWHVLQSTGKVTLCLLETYHTTPRWVLLFPPGHPRRLCPPGRQPQEFHPHGTQMDGKGPPRLQQAEQSQLRVNRQEAGGSRCPI